MSGLFRNGPKPVINVMGGIRVQTSLQGMPIPIVYGRTRIAGNLVWYGDFVAVPATSGKKGYTGGSGSGKKGGGQYDYGAAVIIGLCQGPIKSLGAVWSTQGNLPVNETSETYTVPSGGGSYTATQQPTYLHDLGVTRGDAYTVTSNDYGSPGSITLTGTQQTPMVAGSVSAGHYSLSGAVYTFSAADAGKTMTIKYTYAPPITSGGIAQDPITTIGFSFFNGALGQAVWGYLTSKHPSQAIGYSGLAYVATPLFDLGMSGTLPNLSFEVHGLLPFGSGVGDSNPSDVLHDLLTNTIYGCGIDSSQIGSMTQYSNYCLANGLLISPVLDTARTAADWIKDILEATNSEIVETGGQLLIVPYGDTTVVANGVTYSPATAPIYDLTVDDFIRSGLKPGVRVERPSVQDAYNSVKIEYFDRGNSYNPTIVEAQDLQAIDAYKYRPEGGRQYHMFTTQAPAAKAAASILARLVYIRNKFSFKIPQKYILLDPMDLVTITVPELGYSKQPVRILSIDEQPDRTLDIQAEEFPWGCSGPTLYPKQSQIPGGPNAYAPPGSVNAPIIFEALSRMNNQIGHTIWFGLCGQSLVSAIAADNFGRALIGSGWGTNDNAMEIDATTKSDYEPVSTGVISSGRWLSNVPFPADQSVKMTVTANGGTGTGNSAGVAARMDPGGAQTYYYLWANHFGVQLWSVVAGSQNNLGSYGYAPSIGDVIELRCIGTDLTCLVNGTVVIAVTDTGIASGQPGISGIKTAAGAGVFRANNWIAGQAYGMNPNWGGCRIWVSLDGVTYQPAGTAVGVTKMGLLTANLASHADPDTADTLSVDVTESAGVLPSFTSAECDQFVSLCFVDGELIAYQNSTLTAAFRFDLATKLRRGVYGSAINSHLAGAPFMLLDDSVEGWDYDVGLIGKTVHFKFTSFNQAGLVEENIADVVDYPYTITGSSVGLLTPAHSSYRPLSNPLTAHDAGASATINVASFSMRVAGMADIPFGPGAITGLLFNTLYYVYFFDTGFAAMTPTYLATTVKEDALSGADIMFVGSILTPVTGAPDTAGNNDGGSGAQFGQTNVLMMSLNTQTVISGTGTFTNKDFVVDGDLTSFGELSVSGNGTLNDAQFGLSGPPGLTRRYSAATLYVRAAIPTNNLTPAASSPGPVLIAFYPGGPSTGTVMLSVTQGGGPVALTTYSLALPQGINPSQVVVICQIVADAFRTAGQLTLDVYDARIEAIE